MRSSGDHNLPQGHHTTLPYRLVRGEMTVKPQGWENPLRQGLPLLGRGGVARLKGGHLMLQSLTHRRPSGAMGTAYDAVVAEAQRLEAGGWT